MCTFLRAVKSTTIICCVSGISLAGVSAAYAKSSGLKEIEINKNGQAHNKRYAPEPLQIYISLNNQQLNVFRGLERIRSSNISSGKNGHATPRGIFSILEKRKKHHSNIYNNASMPYMQRLTWSGIALHESNHVPNYPASHGCIRMPKNFSKSLFKLTSYRDHVIISPEKTLPRAVDHPALFQPYIDLQANFALRDSVSEFDFKIAPNINKTTSNKPLRIYITRQSPSKIVSNIQLSLKQLLIYDGKIDGALGQNTMKAVVEFKKLYGYEPNGKIDEKFRTNLAQKAERPMLSSGVIKVRQNHLPIYEANINFDKPTQPLGSHFLVTYQYEPHKTKWIGSTISTKIPRSIVRFHNLNIDRKKRIIANTNNVLSRFKIPSKTRDQIEKMLTPGSSLTISDNGIGTETGKGTDFIVQTH